MRFVGVDLHKHTITVVVVDAARKLLVRKRFSNLMSIQIIAFLKTLGEFQLTVEATASYEWFVQLVEPLAQRIVLAHPGKLRVIAESTRKSDKLDARVLAEMLALDQIPASYRPTPRQRAHRQLVRQRQFWQRKITGVRNKRGSPDAALGVWVARRQEEESQRWPVDPLVIASPGHSKQCPGHAARVDLPQELLARDFFEKSLLCQGTLVGCKASQPMPPRLRHPTNKLVGPPSVWATPLAQNGKHATPPLGLETDDEFVT